MTLSKRDRLILKLTGRTMGSGRVSTDILYSTDLLGSILDINWSEVQEVSAGFDHILGVDGRFDEVSDYWDFYEPG